MPAVAVTRIGPLNIVSGLSWLSILLCLWGIKCQISRVKSNFGSSSSHFEDLRNFRGRLGLDTQLFLVVKLYCRWGKGGSLRNKELGGSLVLIRGACLKKMMIRKISDLLLIIAVSISSSLNFHCEL